MTTAGFVADHLMSVLTCDTHNNQSIKHSVDGDHALSYIRTIYFYQTLGANDGPVVRSMLVHLSLFGIAYRCMALNAGKILDTEVSTSITPDEREFVFRGACPLTRVLVFN